ncbi:MAG: aldehyde dehydrogenase family protein [Actinomycetota bacterium]
MPSDEFGYRSDLPLPTLGALAELPSVSPVDGRIIGWFPTMRPERVAETVQCLRRENEEWSRSSMRERVGVTSEIRRALGARADELAAVLARETGKPIAEAYGAEILPTLHSLRWLERNAARVLGDAPLQRMFRSRRLSWQPWGTIGLISPWNYPLFLSLPIIAAALAAGNTVCWKPSEQALAASQAVMELLESTSAWPLVRMAPGGADVGQALLAADCNKYVLIGGADMGRSALMELGRRGRPAVAELSGVDPMLVCEDADLEAAARAAVWARLVGGGQTCMAPRRLFVHRLRYDGFLQRCAHHLRRVRVGDPSEPTTELGPLRSHASLEAACSAVEDALSRGARLLVGGDHPERNSLYFAPTLLADCTEEMAVFQRDVFGPILAVTSVANDAEAVERANGGPTALTASVWSRSRGRGESVARQLRAGVVSVNDVLLPGAQADAPFGGQGGSGYGRVRGAAGLREMAQPRVTDLGPTSFWPRRHLFPYQPGALDILRAATRQAASDGLEKARAGVEMIAAIRRYRESEERP